jgi:hypothetical protein
MSAEALCTRVWHGSALAAPDATRNFLAEGGDVASGDLDRGAAFSPRSQQHCQRFGIGKGLRAAIEQLLGGLSALGHSRMGTILGVTSCSLIVARP